MSDQNPYAAPSGGSGPNNGAPNYPNSNPNGQPTQQFPPYHDGANGMNQMPSNGGQTNWNQAQNAHGGAPTGPQGYGQPGNYQPVGNDNGMGTAALVCGIVGLVLVPFLGSVLGIIFGHIGMGKVKRGEANNRGSALAGLIMGYIGLALSLLGLIIGIILFMTWFPDGISNIDEFWNRLQDSAI